MSQKIINIMKQEKEYSTPFIKLNERDLIECPVCFRLTTHLYPHEFGKFLVCMSCFQRIINEGKFYMQPYPQKR